MLFLVRVCLSPLGDHERNLSVWLALAGGWCWFAARKKYCCLVARADLVWDEITVTVASRTEWVAAWASKRVSIRHDYCSVVEPANYFSFTHKKPTLMEYGTVFKQAAKLPLPQSKLYFVWFFNLKFNHLSYLKNLHKCSQIYAILEKLLIN